MTAEETASRIREFIGRHIRNFDPRDDDDIFALGAVTSLFAMQLVAFVEQEFGVTVENEDLDIDNFKSIAAIAALVGRKTAAAANA